jgi:hypothetical protein
MTTNTSQKFAFGTNVKNDCNCPVIEAGFHPEDNDLGRITNFYDDILHEKRSTECSSTPVGVVDNDTARDVWIQAMKQAKVWMKNNDRDPTEMLRYGVKVAERLSWDLPPQEKFIPNN